MCTPGLSIRTIGCNREDQILSKQGREENQWNLHFGFFKNDGGCNAIEIQVTKITKRKLNRTGCSETVLFEASLSPCRFLRLLRGPERNTQVDPNLLRQGKKLQLRYKIDGFFCFSRSSLLVGPKIKFGTF